MKATVYCSALWHWDSIPVIMFFVVVVDVLCRVNIIIKKLPSSPRLQEASAAQQGNSPWTDANSWGRTYVFVEHYPFCHVGPASLNKVATALRTPTLAAHPRPSSSSSARTISLFQLSSKYQSRVTKCDALIAFLCKLTYRPGTLYGGLTAQAKYSWRSYLNT
jgi:hypothetical protein